MVHYKNLFVFVVTAFLPNLMPAQVYPDTSVNKLLRSGIDKIINSKYEEAKKDFEIINSNYPNLPLGKIYIAAVSIAQSLDYGNQYDSDYILFSLNAAIDQSNGLLEKDKDNIWSKYFNALSEGFYAYYNALTNNWITAFTIGFESVLQFDECLAQDSKFYEAYIAIGTFKYWKNRKTEFLKWLPIKEDEKADGINYLQKAIAKASYNTYLAVNSLFWIYIDDNRYNDALVLVESALKKYPNSRFYKWMLARVYEEIDKSISIKLYTDILNSYSQLNGLNRYNEIVLKHIIAQLEYKTGNKNKALSLCSEILAVKNISDYVMEKLGNRLERVKKLKEEILQ